jgi:hypothetical protein
LSDDKIRIEHEAECFEYDNGSILQARRGFIG